MGVNWTTRDPQDQKKETDIYKILKFSVNCANSKQDKAVLKNFKIYLIYGPVNCGVFELAVPRSI